VHLVRAGYASEVLEQHSDALSFSLFSFLRSTEKRLGYLECLALALIIFGARLWLIANYGSQLPSVRSQWTSTICLIG